MTMKIEWVEEAFPDLAGDEGAFNSASRDKRRAALPVKKVPMLRTCHGDLVKAPSSALGM
jgi:hypothetical protein